MTRRRREVVVLPDGTEVVQTKPPRADLLRYPHAGGALTVLVRRTHDLELARVLADERWRVHFAGLAIPTVPPLLTGHRVGWWTTTTARTVPARGAADEQQRVVAWCDDPERAHSAGPGIELRP